MKAVNFGKYLRNLRKKRGLTIRQVELASGVSNSYLSQVETGSRGRPSPEILKRLAPVLRVPYEELMAAAGYLPNDTQKSDNLETQWPEGVKVLRRAHGKLDDAERKRMLRLINAFIDEVEEEAAKKDKR